MLFVTLACRLAMLLKIYVEKSPRSHLFASLVSAPNVLPNLREHIFIKEIIMNERKKNKD